ncbi:hypothetical protein Brsp05_04526 [Brucella sp. NBRC 12953]|uniref:hypothetical protein n=1 Tax=Brucella sp. NBRC 12953 TaxID=3075481 RepID=UPI00309993F1
MPPRLFIENYGATTNYLGHLLHVMQNRCNQLIARWQKARQRRSRMRTLQSLPPAILRDIGWPAILDDSEAVVDSRFVHHLPTKLSPPRHGRRHPRGTPPTVWHDPIA